MPNNRNRTGKNLPVPNSQSRSPQTPPAIPITPEQFERMLCLQEDEMRSKIREQELKGQESQNTYDYAKQALAAKIEDNKSARRAQATNDKYRYVFWSSIVIALLSFLAFALWQNKDAIALEIIKGLILVGTGYLGGKYHQKSKDTELKEKS